MHCQGTRRAPDPDRRPSPSASAFWPGPSGKPVLTAQSVGGATPPSPSLADIFSLIFYPLAYVAAVIFVRGDVRGLTASKWLDGSIAGLGAAAVCGAFVFHGMMKDSGQPAPGR